MGRWLVFVPGVGADLFDVNRIFVAIEWLLVVAGLLSLVSVGLDGAKPLLFSSGRIPSSNGLCFRISHRRMADLSITRRPRQNSFRIFIGRQSGEPIIFVANEWLTAKRSLDRSVGSFRSSPSVHVAEGAFVLPMIG